MSHWSGRRGSNPRPSAWKADALPTELLPQFGPIFQRGMQRYNFLRYALQVVDNFLGFLCRNRRESPKGLPVPLDHLFEHGFGPYPYASFTIHGLIYDHLLEGFRMFCYVKDTVDVALEMSVVLFHGCYSSIIICFIG